MARGSGALAKSYVLLPLIFGLALASACIASPFIKILNDELAKTRPLGKIFTHCVVVFAFVYFLVFRRHMRSAKFCPKIFSTSRKPTCKLSPVMSAVPLV